MGTSCSILCFRTLFSCLDDIFFAYYLDKLYYFSTSNLCEANLGVNRNILHFSRNHVHMKSLGQFYRAVMFEREISLVHSDLYRFVFKSKLDWF